MPPWISNPLSWSTSNHFAHLLGKSSRTVRVYCLTGVLASFGIRSYYELHTNPQGQWWIEVPPDYDLPAHLEDVGTPDLDSSTP
jgi:hypothetical protein